MSEVAAEFPGADLVRAGLADLAAGHETQAALLVSMAAPRLRAIGFDVPEGIRDPSHRLCEVLSAEDAGAHSRYNALVGRVVSFARAAERATAG